MMEHYISAALRFTPTQIFGLLWLFIIIAPIGIFITVWITHTNWLKKAKEKGRRTSGTVIEKRLYSKDKRKRYKLFISYTGDDGVNYLATIDGDIELRDINIGQSVQIIYVPGKYQTIMLADEYGIQTERM